MTLNTFLFMVIWQRTIQIVREETHCCHYMGYFSISSKGSFIYTIYLGEGGGGFGCSKPVPIFLAIYITNMPNI